MVPTTVTVPLQNSTTLQHKDIKVLYILVTYNARNKIKKPHENARAI
jgi:hypothetical protein